MDNLTNLLEDMDIQGPRPKKRKRIPDNTNGATTNIQVFRYTKTVTVTKTVTKISTNSNEIKQIKQTQIIEQETTELVMKDG